MGVALGTILTRMYFVGSFVIMLISAIVFWNINTVGSSPAQYEYGIVSFRSGCEARQQNHPDPIIREFQKAMDCGIEGQRLIKPAVVGQTNLVPTIFMTLMMLIPIMVFGYIFSPLVRWLRGGR